LSFQDCRGVRYPGGDGDGAILKTQARYLGLPALRYLGGIRYPGGQGDGAILKTQSNSLESLSTSAVWGRNIYIYIYIYYIGSLDAEVPQNSTDFRNESNGTTIRGPEDV